MAGQWELFLYAGLLGVLLGAYYDVFRIIRYLTAQGKRQTFFWDLFYFFSSGVATFLFLLAANQGQMRFYLLAGELISPDLGAGHALYQQAGSKGAAADLFLDQASCFEAGLEGGLLDLEKI